MDTYSVKEIADMLNTNPETVRRWIRSGKLEAIQESRKGGNVVTKSMLDAFLKTSPKYAGIATGLLASPVGLTTATAAIVGGILAQQLIKNDEIKNAHVNTSEIRKLLLGNIQSSKEIIARKKKSIKHLQEEIDEEQQRINEAERLIRELDEKTKSQEEEQYGSELGLCRIIKSCKAAGGPEKYVEMLELVSKEAGKMEMLPWLGVAAVGASLLTAATIKVVDYFKSRKKNNETEIEKAKAETIKGIKEYDAAHSDEKGGSEDE